MRTVRVLAMIAAGLAGAGYVLAWWVWNGVEEAWVSIVRGNG